MAVDHLAARTGALLVLIGILPTASDLLLGLRHSLLLWIGICLLDTQGRDKVPITGGVNIFAYIFAVCRTAVTVQSGPL